MKKLIYILIFIVFTKAHSQFTELQEYTSYEVMVDPMGSLDYNSPNFGFAFAFTSYKFKIQLSTEIFPALTGGYFDIMASPQYNVNINDRLTGSIGIRFGRAHRRDPNSKIWVGRNNGGVEATIAYRINESFQVGGRYHRTKRNEQEVLGWNPEVTNNSQIFIRIIDIIR